VITLLIIATLAGLAIAFSQESTVDLSLAGYTRDGYRARQVASSGLELALALLDKDEERNVDSPKEAWGLFGVESFPEKLPEDITFSGRIVDENGKLNINKLATTNVQSYEKRKEQLERLFAVLGLPKAHVDAILDWLDSDNVKRMDGAEDYYYQGLEAPYACFNSPLMTLEQLFLVKGLKSIERFGERGEKRLLDFLTIYSEGMININTAPREVLESLDEAINSTIARSIIEYRNEEEFKTTDDLEKVPGIDRELIDRIHPWITVRSSVFSIELEVSCQEAMSRIRAVAVRGGDTSRLIYYLVM
jgi:general secretion pathway protein K